MVPLELLQNVATETFVRQIVGAIPPADSFAWRVIENKPIDSVAWMGGEVELDLRVASLDNSVVRSRYHFWVAGTRVVWISPVDDEPSSFELAGALLDAMSAPLFGDERRPSEIVVPTSAVAQAIREGAADVESDLADLVAIKVGPVDKAQAVALAFLQSHRDRLERLGHLL